MKLRYSLRLLLLLVPAVGGFASFWHLRGKPEKIARQFQVAIQTNNKVAADTLLSRTELMQAVENETPIKQFKLKYQSFEYEPPSFDQWLRGECRGTLQVEARFGSDSPDAHWSGHQDGTVDVMATASGVRILAVKLDDPAMAGAPKPPYGQPNTTSAP